MDVSFGVEDGFGRAKGLHTFYVDDEEIMECDSEDEAIRLVEKYAQEEFNQRISWYLNNFDILEDNIRYLFNK